MRITDRAPISDVLFSLQYTVCYARKQQTLTLDLGRSAGVRNAQDWT